MDGGLRSGTDVAHGRGSESTESASSYRAASVSGVGCRCLVAFSRDTGAAAPD